MIHPFRLMSANKMQLRAAMSGGAQCPEWRFYVD
jgi:hypothetical protein